MASTDCTVEEESTARDMEINENANNTEPEISAGNNDGVEESEQAFDDLNSMNDEDINPLISTQNENKAISADEGMQNSSKEEPLSSNNTTHDAHGNTPGENPPDDKHAGNTSFNCLTGADVQTVSCIKAVAKKNSKVAPFQRPNSPLPGTATCSVVEAIKTKFEDHGTDGLNYVMFVSKGSAGKVDDDIFVPHDLYLNAAGIKTAGEVDELKKLCSEVTELHIATNFIESWNEISTILQCLPKLTCLNLSSNPVVSSPFIPSECSLEGITFPNMTKLILNYCNIKWGTLSQLLRLFPQLMEMHLSFNDFHSIDLDAFEGRTCDSLTMLNINGNGFTTWEEVSKLGQIFPKLKVLYMLDVPLAVLPEGEDMPDVMGRHFPELKQLCLKNCPLRSWQCLEKFRHLPALTHIKLLGSIPILKKLDEKTRQQLILAYLPALTHLNGGRITATEKEDAERAFIRRYMDRDDKPSRYHELEAKYGKLAPLAHVDLSASSDEDLVHVLVSFEDSPSQLHPIDLNWTLRDLYAQFGSLYPGLTRASHVMVLCESPDTPYTVGQMNYYERKLRYYGIIEGMQLQVLKRIWPGSKEKKTTKKHSA